MSAQTAPDPEDPVVRLREFVVAEVPPEEAVNPLARPVGGVFGEARNTLATPRSFSLLTSALFRERAIEGVKEIVLFSPGATTPARFGKATTPNIRGDVAESYLNGQRLSYNLFGYFPSFNGVEEAALVRGAGSALYGAGYFSGGYVNYITKRPRFVSGETVVTARWGSWVPGGRSYANGSLQVDHTAALSDGLAYRVSYEGKDGETFFQKQGVRDDRQDLFLALSYLPSSRVSLEANVQFLWQSSPEILGVNRPSQELIDRGIYYQGEAADSFPFPGVIDPTGTTVIGRDATLFSRSDFSNANVGRGQLLARLRAGEDGELVNRVLVEHVNRRRYHQIEYAEYVTQTTFEDRLEFWWRPQGKRSQELVAGAALRYEERESYVNYFNEYFHPFDITSGATEFSTRERFPSSYFPGLPGPGGRLFFGSAQGSPETTHSKLWNPALFYQHELQVTDRLTALAGWRGDAFLAEAEDPLPAPGTTRWRDEAEVVNNGGHVSLLYRPLPTLSLYATYNRMYAVNGNLTGGGINLYGPEGKIERADFRNLSELYEVGAKISVLQNRLFVGLTAYDQARSRAERGGGRNDIRVRGLEAEAVYQPHARFYATANLALTDARFADTSPFQLGGRSLYDVYASGTGPFGRGTGAGYTLGNQVPPGDYRIPGLSRWVGNASLTYETSAGWGFSLWGTLQSEQQGNLDAEYVIPRQHLINLALFYRRPAWELNLDFLNLTDERNWIHNGDTFLNNHLLFQELPLRVEAYAKFRF